MRQRQVSLHGEVFAAPHDAAGPFVELGAAECLADDRLHARARVGGFDDAVFELRQHRLHRRLLAAPPGGQRGHGQRLAQQMLAERRQKAEQGRGFEEGRTRCIGHQHIAGANHLQQAGHAQRGVGAQFQRVKELVVEPLEQTVHGLQPLQGLEVEPVVAHHQVAAFNQRQAEVARQVGVFKIGFVVRAGGEQHDARLGAGCAGLRAGGFHAVHQRAVRRGQALDFHFSESLWKLQRNAQPVFQQVAQARGRLRALRHHPPAPVGAACQVKGGDVQKLATCRLYALHGPQIAGVALHQRGRQQAQAR